MSCEQAKMLQLQWIETLQAIVAYAQHYFAAHYLSAHD